MLLTFQECEQIALEIEAVTTKEEWQGVLNSDISSRNSWIKHKIIEIGGKFLT
ncbi:hypothetical protein MKL26_06210 [Streptococcus suis]|nr:hypothetical protein [Streptococcus suis]